MLYQSPDIQWTLRILSLLGYISICTSHKALFISDNYKVCLEFLVMAK